MIDRVLLLIDLNLILNIKVFNVLATPRPHKGELLCTDTTIRFRIRIRATRQSSFLIVQRIPFLIIYITYSSMHAYFQRSLFIADVND
jgi:hypothetical protein